MIFASKGAQKMFQAAFEIFESSYVYETYYANHEYDYENFKKQFNHGKCDNYYGASEYHLCYFISEKWDEWVSNLRKEEEKRLKELHSYKGEDYLCKLCNKRKAKDQFLRFDGKYVCGNYGVRVYAHNGIGECEDCLMAEYEAKMREYKRKWYQAHKEEIAAKQKANRAARNEANRKYAKSHREQINQYVSNRKQTDPLYKPKCQVRQTVLMSFKRTGNVKSEKCETITGLSADALVDYLIGTYEEVYGVPWDKQSPVHIDHIIPLATAKTKEEVMRLCHYSNLRLITAKDNIQKGTKLDYAIGKEVAS